MDLIKQLTGKNKEQYEQAAAHIINNADTNAFKELISKDDFLFDFVKQNVSNRLFDACNQQNFNNLFDFLKFYSSSYEDFISEALLKYGDSNTESKLLDLLKNGSDEEKTYSAKYFSLTKNNEAEETLKSLAYSDFEPLMYNCAKALSSLNEHTSVQDAYNKLNSEDDFEVLSAVKFLSAYGEKEALSKIFEVMKKSSVAEYIASEIGYMESFLTLLDTKFYEDTLIAINDILDGLGEIISLNNIFSFQLYEIFEKLIYCEPNSKNAITLLKAKNKFNLLTENDEYLFDEDKNTKNEVFAIKELLNNNIDDNLDEFILEELNEKSCFVYTAADLIKNSDYIKPLLHSKNETLILKAVEIIKEHDNLLQEDKETALKNVTDANIKSIILAL